MVRGKGGARGGAKPLAASSNDIARLEVAIRAVGEALAASDALRQEEVGRLRRAIVSLRQSHERGQEKLLGWVAAFADHLGVASPSFPSADRSAEEGVAGPGPSTLASRAAGRRNAETEGMEGQPERKKRKRKGEKKSRPAIAEETERGI
jgi:hypothetical protein